MEFEELTPEQREKVLACKTPEELLALAQEEGYELTEEQLEGVSGGWISCPGVCEEVGCVGDSWC